MQAGELYAQQVECPRTHRRRCHEEGCRCNEHTKDEHAEKHTEVEQQHVGQVTWVNGPGAEADVGHHHCEMQAHKGAVRVERRGKGGDGKMMDGMNGLRRMVETAVVDGLGKCMVDMVARGYRVRLAWEMKAKSGGLHPAAHHNTLRHATNQTPPHPQPVSCLVPFAHLGTPLRLGEYLGTRCT
eukprot:352895-Chlamydomonas_euryale.AAC.6